MKRALSTQLVRYAANSQAAGVVVLHAAWMLLAAATWQHASADASAVNTVTHELMRAFKWLGGVDADGHGDMDNVLAVWAKLSIVLHLIDAAARRVFGERRPMRLSRVAAMSGVVAMLGYGMALWPAATAQGDSEGLPLLFLAVICLAAAVAAVWAALARRLAAIVVASIHANEGAGRDALAGNTDPQRLSE